MRAASRSLTTLLDSLPRARDYLRDDRHLDHDSMKAEIAAAFEAGGMEFVRVERHLLLLAIAGADLAGELQLEQVGMALAALADACIAAALLEAQAPISLSVIAMGKLGARELNYVSDIDVMFVSEGDPQRAASAAAKTIEALSAVTPQGRAYLVDVNLRPEGRSGALARTLESYLEYYHRWAQPWEFQALIKARSAGGNHAVGQTLVNETRALVYPPSIPLERIAAVRSIKERVESQARRARARGRNSRSFDEKLADVKLGWGGIRDIEFCVQLLQLVHGGLDESVRCAATLDAARALAAGGYLAEEDEAGLSVAYRWLRAVEHRLQLRDERRVVRLPRMEREKASLARAMGYEDSPTSWAYERFEAAHHRVLLDVRSRFEKLFYRPMIESLSEPGTGRLSPAALSERLRLLGFRDTKRAAQILHGLVSGTSRKSRLFRVLAPPFMRSLASTPLPDVGLLSFLSLGEALGERLDVLGALRDNPPGLHLLAHVLGNGRVAGEMLGHVPEQLALIANQKITLPSGGRDQLIKEAKASLSWREPERRWDGLRRYKRRRVLEVMVGDIIGEADARTTGSALTDVAEACIAAALPNEGPALCVIGMGKLGGRELGYSSDIDVMFVHSGDAREAESLAERLLAVLGEVTAEGRVFAVDAGLRPEGKAGPLTRSLPSFEKYYERWAKPWEFLALVKARYVAGNRGLAEGFLQLISAYAFPPRLEDRSLDEIRHLKARMERERIPRGTSARLNLKFGPGGMTDVEFACQMVQITHGHDHPELRVTSTGEALGAASRANLIPEDSARRLREAYEFLYRLRNRGFLLSGRNRDALPTKPEELDALGVAMGFEDQPRQRLEEHYLRLTRRASKVAEPLIYG
ncbi:MAG: bifunctional [glutamine synthetase] adenylyltransferase/[glutamine synthetase]-adenylyl-L-tyrosine phosphorylase [Actinomycetota bacterium]|nr:bifunctional [glutamine synthetase] adenylyltransferase/[glutamine synthetase]-adenylyl-L-tyrosine phosphorylase [Actinomycetota bacterium]